MDHARCNFVAVLLAGGQGSRLKDLTIGTCKPAVSLVGGRRIVDWTMQNLQRAAPNRIIVATQYRPEALIAHLEQVWCAGFAPDVLQYRHGPDATGHPTGYLGTADAVTQNLAEIDRENPDVVLVVAADHVYRMDYSDMIAQHQRSGRRVSVAVDRVPLAQAHDFGVMAVDNDGRVIAFEEKPLSPKAMPGDDATALASMGVYVFDWPWLRGVLAEDARDPQSSHDFGHGILPQAVAAGEVQAYDPASRRAAPFYWRDVGTLDSLRETCIDIASGKVALPLYPNEKNRRQDIGILPCGTVVLDRARVMPGAQLRNVIVAPSTVVPSNMVAGFDAEYDADWFHLTAAGTVLITQKMIGEWRAAQYRRLASVAPNSFRKLYPAMEAIKHE